MNDELRAQRRDYRRGVLLESEAPSDPLELFQRWFDEARAAGEIEPNAMTLATATRDGAPSARIVLLKEIRGGGPVFYTNYESKKGQDLADNPHAALLFFWATCERQVRFDGICTKVDPALSDEYFSVRPRESQLGAWASPQSRRLKDREELDRLARAVEERFATETRPPRPPHWGGYRLQPSRIEFWQGRSSRLHDRLVYTLPASGPWQLSRLAP